MIMFIKLFLWMFSIKDESLLGIIIFTLNLILATFITMAFNKFHKIIKNFGSEKIGRLSGNVVYFDDIAPNDHIDFKKTLLDHIYRVAAAIASKKGMEVFQLNFDARCNGEDLKSAK